MLQRRELRCPRCAHTNIAFIWNTRRTGNLIMRCGGCKRAIQTTYRWIDDIHLQIDDPHEDLGYLPTDQHADNPTAPK